MTRRNKKGGYPFGTRHEWARDDPNPEHKPYRLRSLRRTARRTGSFLTKSLKTRCEDQGYFNLQQFVSADGTFNDELIDNFIIKNTEMRGDVILYTLLKNVTAKLETNNSLLKETAANWLMRRTKEKTALVYGKAKRFGANLKGKIKTNYDSLMSIINDLEDDIEDIELQPGTQPVEISSDIQSQIQLMLLTLIKARCDHHGITPLKSWISRKTPDQKLLYALATTLIQPGSNLGLRILREIANSLSTRMRENGEDSTVSYIYYFIGFRTDLNKAIKTGNVNEVYAKLHLYLLDNPTSDGE